MDFSLSTRTVQVTGISVNASEQLSRSLHFEFKVDDTASGAVFFDKEQRSVERLLETPFYFHIGSVLTIRIREKHYLRDKTFPSVNLTLQRLILGQISGEPDGQIINYQIRPQGFMKDIWIIFKPVGKGKTQTPGEALHEPESTRTVQITGVSKNPAAPLSKSLRVKFKVDDVERGLAILSKKSISVESLLEKPFDFHGGSILAVKIREARLIRDKKFPCVNLTLEKLSLGQKLEEPDSQTKMYQIRPEGFRETIWLNFVLQRPLTCSPPLTSRSTGSTHRSQAMARAERSHLVEDTPHVQEQTEDLLKGPSHEFWDRLTEIRTVLDKMGQEMYSLDTGPKLGETLRQLEMTAKALLACVVVACADKMKTQDEGQEDLLRLVNGMATTVTHIRSVEKITHLNQLKNTLNKFHDLMWETADLVESLAKQNNLASNTAIRSEIDNLQRKHAIFRDEFDRSIRSDEAAIELHPLIQPQDVKELEESLLRGIKLVDPRAIECFEGTRITILDDIMAMMDDLSAPNVIWIRGAPGSGKSSISLTIKSLLQRTGRLVLYFRFDRTEATITTSNALWRCIAYELAKRFPSVLTHNLSLIRSNDIDLTSTMDVFTSLVQEPFSKSTDTPPSDPFVIVIDGLDECGGIDGHSSSDRKSLLQTLRRWPKLPKYLKLLVASREEGDIYRVLPYISTAIEIPSGNFITENPSSQVSSEATRDIRMFLEKRFRDVREHVPSLPRDWPGVKTITEMVGRASGNFMWATAAMNFIDSADPEEQLGRLISQVPNESIQPLYSLYTTILDVSFGNLVHSGSGMEALRAILGSAIFARRPLKDDEYTKLPTNKPVGKAQVESIRNRLRAVADQGPTLRFVHRSFGDFLLSEACPPKYRIQSDQSQLLLTKLCLTTMDANLRFNICNITTSSLRNVDVPDIEAKVKEGISGVLSYSCCFWADHVSRTTLNDELMLAVKEMIFDKLLFWFEAMSLLAETNQVSNALSSVLDWSKFASDKEFGDFISDARQFIRTFIYPISQSAPHIYISALPFAPELSRVVKRFLPQYPRILRLTMGKQPNWSSCIFTSEYHKDSVCCVAFSPDERLLVSGSHDGIICVCDSETGGLIAGPFQENESQVIDAFFDSDGRRIWANHADGEMIGWDIDIDNGRVNKHLAFRLELDGWWPFIRCTADGGNKIVSVNPDQGEVILWSTESGEKLEDLFQISVDSDNEIPVSISPDGCFFAWVRDDDDEYIQITKLVDGSAIKSGKDVQGHTKRITTLSFSIDSICVVTGAEDGSVVVWDAKTAQLVGRPLLTGMGSVDAVAYSHNNGLIVTATGFHGVVTVWNALTHEEILGPLEGHPSRISVIKLSLDCRRVLSGSFDGTVRMWDVSLQGGLCVSHPTDGSTSGMRCVAFTTCGKKLALFGSDGSLRVCDVTTGEEIFSVIDTGVDIYYVNMVFSPDGKYIMLYNGGTLRMWNTDTGNLSFHRSFTNATTTPPTHLAFRSTDNRLIMCSRWVIRAWCLENDTITEDSSISSPIPVDATKPVQIRALSPDGSTICVYDDCRKPPHYLWSTITCQPLPFTFPDVDVDKHAFSYTGSGLLFTTGRWLQELQVWDTCTGKIKASYGEDPDLQTARLSPDDRHIAYSRQQDFSPSVRNTCTGHTEKLWNPHWGLVSDLIFSADGKKLASVAIDGQVRIWDTTYLVDGSKPYEGILGAETCINDGWIMDDHDRLLFWVPNDHRGRLMVPQNIAVFGGPGILTKLDLTEFRCGENWAECFDDEGDR